MERKPKEDQPHKRTTVSLPRTGAPTSVEKPLAGEPSPTGDFPDPAYLAAAARLDSSQEVEYVDLSAGEISKKSGRTLPGTEMLRRESAAKPFFTRVLSTQQNRQHKRLVSVVPLLLVVVIVIFVLAYIAAK